MDESSVTCDTVINAVRTILTPTQFCVFGEHPKVGVSTLLQTAVC